MIKQNSLSSGGLVSQWQSPSNIALVKYWGKWGNQLPQNASLSFTLSSAVTRTRIELLFDQSDTQTLDLDFTFGGVRNPAFAERLKIFLESLIGEFPFLRNSLLKIESENSFPHSAGIASSASAMSALALCLCDLEQRVGETRDYGDAFYRKSSSIARLGSGSAARSVYGGFTVWGDHTDVMGSSNEYAVALPFEPHKSFGKIKNTILIVNASVKKVSSSAGHHLMEGHPFAKSRFEQARTNLSDLLGAIKSGNWTEFSRITENEALSLHAMMMSSNPGYILMHPNTLVILEKMKHFRQQSKANICFTLDAGPNIHLIYPETETDKVRPFLNQVQEFCVNPVMIDDHIGNGPINLENHSNET